MDQSSGMSTERLSSCNTLRVGCETMDTSLTSQIAIAENHKANIMAKIEAGFMVHRMLF